MRTFAFIMWAVAAVWIVLVIIGAEEFQELYGGTSGLQFFALAGVIALVPLLLGWWAYRRSAANAMDGDR
jgi:membrane protease YdiL (CAAX protease family)